MSEESSVKSVELSDLWLGSFIVLLDNIHKLGYEGNAGDELIDWIESKDIQTILEGINNIIDDISPTSTE